MKRLMILLCGLLLWISSASAGQPGGYFLVFELHQGHLQAPTIMQIDEYVASPALPEAADAWQLEVLDGAGVALFSTALSDPYRLQRAARGDVGEPLLMARVPQLEGAERMQLSDADGKADCAETIADRGDGQAGLGEDHAEGSQIVVVGLDIRQPQGPVVGDPGQLDCSLGHDRLEAGVVNRSDDG